MFPLIRLLPSAKSTCTLAVPKIFCSIRLEYFDRGAKPCSLLRPLGALRKLCSKGRLEKMSTAEIAVLIFVFTELKDRRNSLRRSA